MASIDPSPTGGADLSGNGAPPGDVRGNGGSVSFFDFSRLVGPPAASNVIEDFESGTLEAYKGSTGGYANIQSGTVFEGSNALEVSQEDFIYALPADGDRELENYPSTGQSFKYHQRIANPGSVAPGALPGFAFGVQDESNHYLITLDHAAGSVTVSKVVSGSKTVLTSFSTTLPLDEWFRVEVEWVDGGILKVFVYDSTDVLLGSTAVNDATYTDGGIGWGGAV